MKRLVAASRALPATTPLLMFLLSGCYSMSSSPYGYGTTYAPSPGVYSAPYQAPIQTLTPGQPYIPNGGLPSTIPQGGTPTFQGSRLTPVPDNGPGYNAAPNPGGPYNPQPNGGPVPSPYFPDGNSTQLSPLPRGLAPGAIQQASALVEPLPLSPPRNAIRELPTAATVSSAPSWTNQAGSNVVVQPAGRPDENQFALPQVGSAGTPNPFPSAASGADPFGASSSPTNIEAHKLQVSIDSEFGHDEQLKWVRGVVSREPQDGTWSIVYHGDPNTADRFAGHLSLAPCPHLKQLKEGDVVEIHGQLNEFQHDRLGKPTYLVTDLRVLAEQSL